MAGIRAVTVGPSQVDIANQAFGFTLTQEERHHSFGHDLLGQHWTLELT